LNESSDGVTNASDEASKATVSSATYGYTYEHSLFLSRDYLFQNTSATWNDLKGKGLIFGTNMELGGITYRLRAPSGDKETENSEWNVMRTKAKDQTFFDAIRDTSCYAMMQDTTSNGSYIWRGWQYGFSQTYNKDNNN